MLNLKKVIKPLTGNAIVQDFISRSARLRGGVKYLVIIIKNKQWKQKISTYLFAHSFF